MKKLTIMLCVLGITSSSCKKEHLNLDEYPNFNTTYIKNYIHLQHQEDESLWTNYVLCAGTISKTHCLDYRVDTNEIQWVKNHCHDENFMETLERYARDYDTHLVCRYESMKAHEKESQVLKTMLEHLETHHTPFILAIEEDQHLIIWSIDQQEDIVYYSDSRLAPKETPQQNIKKIPLTTLLRWAKNGKYRFIFMWYKV